MKTDAHNNLGNVLKKLGQLDSAVKSYEKALAIKPDYFDAHYNLGNALNDLDQHDAAVKCYEKALAINPDYADAHNNLGFTLKKLGQLDSAVNSYEKALMRITTSVMFSRNSVNWILLLKAMRRHSLLNRTTLRYIITSDLHSKNSVKSMLR